MNAAGEHVTEARGYLAFAERARNADSWRGDRNADSQAAGVIALAHAATAIALELELVVAELRAGTKATYDAAGP